jgi:hypothetical protein
MMDMCDKPLVHPQVAARRLEDAELLLLADAGEVLVLNAAGCLLWEGIEAGESMAELAQRLTVRYGLVEEWAQADAARLVDALAAAGAVVRG